MTVLILVHGAWHGPWAWEPTMPALRDHGFTVDHVDVSLNQVGRDGSLEDQARLVADAIATHRRGAILIGHSHGGLVAQEALAMAPPGTVRGIIGVDGWFAHPSETFLETVPSWMADAITSGAVQDGTATIVPAPPPVMFGINDDELAAQVAPKLTAQPMGTLDQRAVGTSLREACIPGVAIVCEPRVLPFADLAEEQGLDVVGIESGHDAMLLVPDLLNGLLVTAVKRVLASG